jgi:hypothetical protein
MRKEERAMCLLLLEVLHFFAVDNDPCINIDINNIIVYVWGRH